MKAKPSPWAYRNLAEAMKLKGKNDIALTCMEKAYMLAGGFPDKALAEEYLDLLIQNKEYQKAWKVYESLPVHFSKSDRIQMIVASAALELDKEEFVVNLFNKEFAVLREGEMSNVNLWYRYNAKKVAKEREVLSLRTSLSGKLCKNCLRRKTSIFGLCEYGFAKGALKTCTIYLQHGVAWANRAACTNWSVIGSGT